MDHIWPMFKIHSWHNHDYHHHVTHPYMSLDVLPEPSSPNQVMSTRVPVAHPQHPVLCSYLYLSVYLISCFIALWGYMQVQTKTKKGTSTRIIGDQMRWCLMSCQHVAPRATSCAQWQLFRPNLPSVILIARRGCLTGTRPQSDTSDTRQTATGDRSCDDQHQQQ